jgi:hypothetical protein
MLIKLKINNPAPASRWSDAQSTALITYSGHDLQAKNGLVRLIFCNYRVWRRFSVLATVRARCVFSHGG